MTLDSSVLIAILFSEPNYLDLVDRILEADHVRVGAPTLVEAGMVFAGRGGARSAESVEGLIRELNVTVVQFGEAEWLVARIGRDGRLHENEKALLAFLRERGPA